MSISKLHKIFIIFFPVDWRDKNDEPHELVKRQLSVSSDSKLLDEDICEETRVILRPKKPPRPKSEVFLSKDQSQRRTKRFSAFGVSELLSHFKVAVDENDDGHLVRKKNQIFYVRFRKFW